MANFCGIRGGGGLKQKNNNKEKTHILDLWGSTSNSTLCWASRHPIMFIFL